MQTATFTIPAMQDQASAIAVAQALEAIAGVDKVHLTIATRRARVAFSEGLATPEQLHGAVAAAGFAVETGAGHAAGGCCGGCGGG